MRGAGRDDEDGGRDTNEAEADVPNPVLPSATTVLCSSGDLYAFEHEQIRRACSTINSAHCQPYNSRPFMMKYMVIISSTDVRQPMIRLIPWVSSRMAGTNITINVKRYAQQQ